MWRLRFVIIADQHDRLFPAAHRHRQRDPDGRTRDRGGFRGHESAVANLANHIENCGVDIRSDHAHSGKIAGDIMRQEGDGVGGERRLDDLAGLLQNLCSPQHAGHVLGRAHERARTVIRGEAVARHGHPSCPPVNGRRKR